MEKKYRTATILSPPGHIVSPAPLRSLAHLMHDPRYDPLRILPVPRPLDAHDPFHRLLAHLHLAHFLAERAALLGAYDAVGRLLLAQAVHAGLAVRYLVRERPLGIQDFVHVGGGLGGAG